MSTCHHRDHEAIEQFGNVAIKDLTKKTLTEPSV